MKVNNAPVLVFAYNRYDLLKNTLTYLSKNVRANDTDVFIFVDGPKSINDNQIIDKIHEDLKK